MVQVLIALIVGRVVRSARVLAALVVFLGVCGVVSPAMAQKLRRPYSPSIAFNYGFDNRSGAGCRDWNCGGLCYDGHTGTDQPTPIGTNIVSGAAGRVTGINNSCADYGYRGNTCGGRCGNYVQVTHGDGSVAIYCHMKRNSFTVSNGQRVSCGQKLGQSASSGSSTGPHLHLGWRRSSGGASQDSFRGSCTSSPGCWNQQNGYRTPVGTACVNTCSPSREVCDGKDNDCDNQVDEGVKNACGKCGAVPKEVCDNKDNDCDGRVDEGVKNACGKCGPVPAEVCDGKDNDCDGQTDEGLLNACGKCGEVPKEICDGKDNDCDGETDEGDLCEIAWLNAQAGMYAPARTTDINGDGQADVCGRGGAGLWCHEANGSGFALEPRSQVVPMESAAEWKEARHYATLRMGDIDGDGLADVCGRGAQGVRCWASDGQRGWVEFAGPTLSDESGWGHPRHYSTLRLADINGDGKDDLCARAGRGLLCWPSTGRGFGAVIEGPAWSNDNGFGAAKYYGTLRFGDVTGDGLEDACIRHKDAYVCAPSNGQGFDDPFEVAPWGDAQGFGELRRWATITLADVDGDGAADVCARGADEVLGCVTGLAGEASAWRPVATLAAAQGWDAASQWDTLRAGDVDDDGRDELCMRSAAGVVCWAWDGAAFVEVSGPAWSDERGFNEASKYMPLRMGDINGDGKDDLCTRAHAGWICHTAQGAGFSADQESLAEFKSDAGWSAEQHWATIQLGGPRCAQERCNGRDDDCDGLVDDDPEEVGQGCDPGSDDPCQLGMTACVGGVVRCEAMAAQRPECMMAPDLGGGGESDMAGMPDLGPSRPSVEATGEVGCACEVAPRRPVPASWLWALSALALGVVWRRRGR